MKSEKVDSYEMGQLILERAGYVHIKSHLWMCGRRKAFLYKIQDTKFNPNTKEVIPFDKGAFISYE